MRFFLTFVLAVVTSVAIAKPASGEKTVEDLKAEASSTADITKKFYAESGIVRLYASENLSEGNIADARKAAESLLITASSFKDNWDYGNAIHHSHLVLGRVNLFEGKLDEAKQELKLASQTPGSPQLNSFGPNMTLAKELLEKGEKAAVLEYFHDCAKFWNDEIANSIVAEWKSDIQMGKMPEFRGNLVY